jgi:hypothetical protein
MTAIGISTIDEGLNYILSHLDTNYYPFPRRIMTRRLNGQIEIWNKESALKEFELSNCQDCRINAYPTFTITKSKWISLVAVAPSMVFIDLDLQYFKNHEALDRALRSTIRLIQKSVLSGPKTSPTVLWTGNEYHVYLPISGLILEEESVFAEFISKYQSLTTKFMRFAEQYFTGNKQDPNHKPSINNCLLRIPGTYNSKNGQQVRIVQQWNGYRIPIQYLLREFRRYLIQEKIDNHYLSNNNNNTKNNNSTMTRTKTNSYNEWISKNQNQNQNHITWIEKLLLTPVGDGRKYCIWRIFAPYLVNVKMYVTLLYRG